MVDKSVEANVLFLVNLPDGERERYIDEFKRKIVEKKKETADTRSMWKQWDRKERISALVSFPLISFAAWGVTRWLTRAWPASNSYKMSFVIVAIIAALFLLVLFIPQTSNQLDLSREIEKLDNFDLAVQEYERRRNSIWGEAEQRGFVFSKAFCNNNLTACLAMDSINKKVLIKDDMPISILSYNQIVSSELCKDGKSIISGDASKAIAGGMLFGTVGAVIGAAGASNSVDKYCTEMYVSITDDKAHRYKLYLIRSTVAESSTEYKKALECARDMFSILSVIEAENAKENKKPENNSTTPIVEEQTESAKPSYVAISEADEIVKFKELLDKGVITQDEFDAKKKQLLGL